MALSQETRYPGRVDPSSPEYPHGKAKNVLVPGDGTGTPWEKDLVNDWFGFFQSLLSSAGIVPSGSPDQVGSSQYYQALLQLTKANFTFDTYNSGTDFTPGVTTQLTLSSSAAVLANTQVYFDGDYVEKGEYTLDSNTTLNFTSPIPAGVSVVECVYGSTSPVAFTGSTPYIVPPFTGTTFTVPGTALSIVVYIDGQFQAPDTYSFDPVSGEVVLESSQDITNKVVAILGGITLPTTGEGTVTPKFSTVGDMKSGVMSNGLTVPDDLKFDGAKWEWLGYFNAGDGGYNWGIYRTGVHTEDGVKIISLGPTTYIETNEIDGYWVEQAGGMPDNDVSSEMIAILAVTNKLNLTPGASYFANDVELQDGRQVWMNGATVTQVPLDTSIGRIFVTAEDSSDIVIRDGTLIGDKYTHLNGVGEGVHNIYIKPGTDNVLIENMISNAAFGDGLYLADYIADNPVKKVTVKNFRSTDCRRQGISITSCLDFYGENIRIASVGDDTGPWPLPNGPWAGIDIEPNGPSTELERIVLRDVRTFQCKGEGILFFLPTWMRGIPAPKKMNISVEGHYDDGSEHGLRVVGGSIGGSSGAGGTSAARLLGELRISDCVWINSRFSGFKCSHWTNEKGADRGNARLVIDRPTVINYNRSGSTVVENKAAYALMVDDLSGNDYGSSSGIDLIEPKAMFTSDVTPPDVPRLIYSRSDVSGRVLRNSNIFSPQQTNGMPYRIQLNNATDVRLISERKDCGIQQIEVGDILGYGDWLLTRATVTGSSPTVQVAPAVPEHECLVVNGASGTVTISESGSAQLRDSEGNSLTSVSMSSSGARVRLTWITDVAILAEPVYGSVTLNP